MLKEIEARRGEMESLCREFGVRRLDVFGSAAANMVLPATSDLDFLVEFESPGAPGYADRYFGLLEALGDLFGRRVDLVVESAMRNPYFRQSVERTRSQLYAA